MKSHSGGGRTFLGCEDEVAAIVFHRRRDGLAREEIVAEIDGPQRREPVAK
jgi:hypothetical protein